MNRKAVVLLLALAPSALTSREAFAQAAARGTTVSHALDRLNAARQKLTKANERAEREPPADADLEAALRAVEELKEAIDAGAEHEAADLDYARAALAARKELRTRRAFLEDRRAKSHLHAHRRAIDAAVSVLTERMSALERDGGEGAFTAARDAVAALAQALDRAKADARADAAFERFVQEVGEDLARRRKTVEDRWALRGLEAQRAALVRDRDTLTTSLSDLVKGDSDAAFEAADRAVRGLARRLEEGAALEGLDAKYRSEAARAREELAAAQKRLPALLSAAALKRLKGEIEPAHRDLVAALKPLRTSRPSEEQLAEARTAAIVVRKLVERFAPQASRSPEFGRYIEDVRKDLVQCEGLLLERALRAAVAEVNTSVKALQRRDATPAHFDELATALTILEKTMEGTPGKEPALAGLLRDAQTLAREAKATMARRREELEIQAQRQKVQDTKREVEGTVRDIQRSDAGDEELLKAETALGSLAAVLDGASALVRRDREYAQFEREVRERVAELRGRVAARRIVVNARAGRARLAALIAAGRERLERGDSPEATDAEVEAAGAAVAELEKGISDGASLERQDAGYATHAERARAELQRQVERLSRAQASRDLRRQTGEALAAGESLLEAADSVGDLRKRRATLEKGIGLLRSCETDGRAALRGDPALGRIMVLVDGTLTPPGEVLERCAASAKAAEPRLNDALALIAFEEGPRRSFERGKGLLSQAKRHEAREQFGECIATGKIAFNRYPALRERRFPVAGSTMTLTELIGRCVSQHAELLEGAQTRR